MHKKSSFEALDKEGFKEKEGGGGNEEAID